MILVVLDEYNMALFFELIDMEKNGGSIRGSSIRKPKWYLRGAGHRKNLLDVADLVTEMKEVKHYYMQGVMARKGIEN